MIQEPETGRGPVDYAFIYGFVPRIQNCHLEIKLSKHSCIPENFEPQLNTYIVADSATAAIFLVARVADGCGPIPDDIRWVQWREVITEKLDDLSNKKNISIKAVFIDAIKKPIASKVKG